MKFGTLLLTAMLGLHPRLGTPEEPAATPSKDPVALQDELEKVLRQLHQKREEYYRERQTREEKIKALAEEVEALEQERAGLKAEEDALRQGITRVSSGSGEPPPQQTDYVEFREEARSLLTAFSECQMDALRRGLPYRQEQRSELLTRLASELKRPNTPLSVLMDLAWVYAEGQLRDAAEGEGFTAEIDLPGSRRKPARFCRLGLVFLAFITEDGQEIGYARDGTAGANEWILDLDRGLKGGIRDAVRILDRRVPPHLQSLPVNLRFGGNGDGK